jgi:hypothetical protein
MLAASPKYTLIYITNLMICVMNTHYEVLHHVGFSILCYFLSPR